MICTDASSDFSAKKDKVTGNNTKLVFEKIPGVSFSENILERRLNMDIVIAVIVGAIAGVIITLLIFSTISAGNLRLDQSISEDDPYLFLELTKSISAVFKKKFVVLRVRVEDFIPHK